MGMGQCRQGCLLLVDAVADRQFPGNLNNPMDVGLQTGGQSVDPPLNHGGIHQPIFPNDWPPRRCK